VHLTPNPHLKYLSHCKNSSCRNRTICLHPFDRRFFRRDLAMPALGFETFLGRETLGGSRRPPYMSDPELAGHILRTLDAEGPHCFIFAITMGNHGPWLSTEPPIDPAVAGFVDDGIPQRAELLRYLVGLRRSDEMLQILIDGLARRDMGALLGFYGDHLPSLPRAFAHLGFDDWRSDYAIRSAEGISRPRDLAAHELAGVLADLALTPPTSAVLDAVVAEPHDA
jgi:phosphoglycerol transferase MdoB-like AlkP superfamily enzyme